MISTLTPDRPDQAFNIAVLPGCTERGGGPHSSLEDAAKCSVIVANDDPLRTVLMLSALGGLTDHEIAQTLGISQGNAKVRLHRARQEFKKIIRSAM